MAYTVYYDTPGTLLTYTEMNTALANLCTANGWTLVIFGKSAQGRDIKGVVVNGTGYTKTVLIDAGIHGDETTAQRCVLDWLNYYAANPTIYISYRFVVIPHLNPDAVVAGTRKNVNDTTDDGVSPFPRYVNLNRNFPIGWGRGSSSTTAADADYQGPAAGSEPETRVMKRIIDTYGPQYHITNHQALDYMICGTSNYLVRKTTVDALMTTNQFNLYPWAQVGLSGQWSSYTASRGLEAYNIECASTTVHQEVNRTICAILGLMSSFDSESLPLKNNFILDPSCVMHYRYESGALTTDQTGLHTLTSAGVASITSANNFAEGLGAADFEASGNNQYQSITDANSSNLLPFKSGTTNKTISIFGRFKLESANAVQYLWSKYQAANNKRCFLTGLTSSNILIMGIGYNNGTQLETMAGINANGAVTGVWYYFGLAYDGNNKAWFGKLYDAANNTSESNNGAFNNNVYISDAPVNIGRIPTSGYLDGILDDIAVFNSFKNETDFDAMFADRYGAGAVRGEAFWSFEPVGSLSGAGALTGAMTGASDWQTTFTGVLLGRGALAGTAAFQLSPTAILKGVGQLTGAAVFSTTLNGLLQGMGSLTGSFAILNTTTGALQGMGSLDGTSVWLTTFSGDLIAPLASGEIHGTVIITSTFAGQLVGLGKLTGASNWQLSMTGTLLAPLAPSDVVGGQINLGLGVVGVGTPVNVG